MSRTVVLWDTRDARGTRFLSASLTPGGDLRIEGQDLGRGVEEVFGAGLTEYEYAITVQAHALPALQKALGTETELLAALQTLFQRGQVAGPATWLDDIGIPYEFWSRVGD